MKKPYPVFLTCGYGVFFLLIDGANGFISQNLEPLSAKVRFVKMNEQTDHKCVETVIKNYNNRKPHIYFRLCLLCLIQIHVLFSECVLKNFFMHYSY